tara:strand:- start:73 stop:705 length:633 start_codon:yes stop_codon:yes gene_type:complete
MSKRIQEKGILAKLLEKGIQLLIKKECKKIGKININIIASSIQIIKGIIQKIYIIAKDINYKDLLFDQIELEANDIEIIYKINNKELKFKNNFTIKFKITLSENSLKKILLSNNWNWIGDMISKEILNHAKLEDIEIKNGQILITTSKDIQTKNEVENVYIKAENGKIFLENKTYNKSIKIPIEDKVCIKNINIRNNLINIFANSSISFD